MTEEKHSARQATIVKYASRFGNFPFTVKYRGEFPFVDVAMSTPITAEKDLYSHRKVWAELFRNFDLAWAEYDQ